MKTSPKIRVTKQFSFEMAHALHGHDGPCRNIHGHSYRLSVTLIGTPSRQDGDPKLGMVMDFADLKQIVKKTIIDKVDHALVLNQHSSFKDKIQQTELYSKVLLTDFQPTCENLLIDFVQALQNSLPKSAKLHHMKLRETPTSYAEWFANDNV